MVRNVKIKYFDYDPEKNKKKEEVKEEKKKETKKKE